MSVRNRVIIDEGIVAALACPWDRGPLRAADGGLRCDSCGRLSAVRAGILEAMGPRRAARTPAQLVNRLTPVAWTYEAGWRRHSLRLLSGRPFPVAEELGEVARAVGDVRGELVVDMACSEGLYARHIAGLGAQVLAVDHSRAFLRRVMARSRRAGVAGSVVAVRALAQYLPVRDGGVAAVVIGGSLNEIGDGAGALREAARVLRPGGRLFSMSLLRSPSPRGRAGQRLLGIGGIRFFSEAETMALLPPSLEVAATETDGIVFRLTATKVG